MRQIEETKRLIAVYRNANEVIVGTQVEVYSRRGLMNRTTVTGADTGGGDLVGPDLRVCQRRAGGLLPAVTTCRCNLSLAIGARGGRSGA